MGRRKVQVQLWLAASVINIEGAPEELSKEASAARSAQVTVRHKALLTGLGSLRHLVEKCAVGIHLMRFRQNQFGNSLS